MCSSEPAFQDPLNMAWKICQQLTTVNKINKTLAITKDQFPGTKLYIKSAPSIYQSTERKPIREPKGLKHSRTPISDAEDRQSHPIKASSCKNRCPHLHRHNTCIHVRYESESDNELEEPYIPRCFHMGSIKLYQHSDTNTDDEYLQSDTSSEDEHSLMDYQSTSMPTFSPPCNMKERVTPHNHVQEAQGHDQNPTATECQKPAPAHTCPQPMRKTPLLPTPPASDRQHVRNTFISGPPLHNNNRYQYKQYFSRPHSIVINNRQCPSLLPTT